MNNAVLVKSSKTVFVFAWVFFFYLLLHQYKSVICNNLNSHALFLAFYGKYLSTEFLFLDIVVPITKVGNADKLSYSALQAQSIRGGGGAAHFFPHHIGKNVLEGLSTTPFVH